MYNTWNKHIFRQCLAVIAFGFDSILNGAVITFSATLLDQLQQDNSSIKITKSEATWIASISSIGPMISTILIVGFLQLFGRKWSYLLISLSNMICWSLLTLSTEVWHLYLGRALLGLINGISFSLCFIFVVETIELKYRNIALNIANAGITIGMLFVDAMGSYFKWQTTAYVLSGFAAISVVSLLCLQNTHLPYLQKGDTDKAAKQFFWYRKESPENWEIFNSEKNIASVKVSFAELKDEWKRKEFLIPLGILIWFIATFQFTGGMGMKLYSVEIMRGVVSIDEYLTVIITDVLGVLASFGTLIILEYITVRLLINLTSVICASSLMIISLSLYLADDWTGWSTVTVAMVWIFNFCCSLGYSNAANVLFGQLFTGVGVSSGMAMVALFIHLMIFSMGHLIPFLFDDLGNSGTFLFFGCCTIVGGAVLYFIIPDIKGKTNEEIRLMFKNYTLRRVRNDTFKKRKLADSK